MSASAVAQAEPVGVQQPETVEYVVAQPTVTYAAPAVTYAAPVTYAAAPTVTYAAPPMPDVQYVNELGQPCTADGQPLQFVNELGQPCTQDGQLLGEEVQYVNEQGQPCTADGQPLGDVQCVNELGQPCTVDGQLLLVGQPIQGVPMTYGAPARFNITPEQFAIILQGGSLPQEHIEGLLAGNAPTAPVAAETAVAVTEEAAAANTEAKKEKKASKKLSSKKKSKGCC